MMRHRLLSIASAVALISVLAPSHGVGAAPTNSPPTISVGMPSINGARALVFDIVDADGAADITGVSYDYLRADGSKYGNPLQFTLGLIAGKGLAISDITNGKRVTITQGISGVASITCTSWDKCFKQVSATGQAPAFVAKTTAPKTRR